MASPQNSVLEELYKYNPSSVVELFQLELSPLQSYYPTINPIVYRFHNGYNETYGTPSPNVVWNGAKYNGRPIQMEGVQFSSSGEIPRPTLTVANHDLAFTQLNKAYANLVGAKVRRIRTFVKFLDSENFQTKNLLINSEALDTWTQSSAADTDVASNVAVAPNGTLTADKIYEATNTSASHSIVKAVGGLPDNTNVCFSVYLKAAERQYATLAVSSKASSTGGICGKTFDLTNGTVGTITRTTTPGPSVVSSGIAPAGNGWYRCWVVASTQSGSPDRNPQYYIYIDNNFDPTNLTYAGSSPSGIYAWGAQAEVVSNPTLTPTTYQPTSATLGNPTADPNAKFPDDVYVIDRMSEEVPGQITYELAPAWDVEGVQLPRRQVVANICPWVYKQDPCTWANNGAVTVSYTSGSASAAAVIAATITGTTMTVTTVTSGVIRPGMFLTGGTVLAGTEIVSQLTGTTGSTGTYTVSKTQSATAITGATPVGTHTSVPIKSTTQSGRNALLSVAVATAGASYSGATITVTNPGTGYIATESLTIDGTYLGGVTGTNDLVVSVSSVNSQYFDQDGSPVANSADDRCGKTLSSCRIRFGSRALPFGGFPSAGLYGKPI